jgi:hypothetical protein
MHVSARQVLAFSLGSFALLALSLGSPAARGQQPAADLAASAQLIRTAQPDANGFLYMPLPGPAAGEALGAFEARKLRARNDMLRNLRSELPLDPATQSIVDNYFNLFEFKALTQTTPEDLEQLPKRRFDLFKLYILQVKNSENHKKLVDLTLAMMQQIVMNNFHPLVRYNAMLIIGDLNEQEVLRVGGTPTLPEPYSAALNFIVERVEDPRTSDPVRVAALIGLVRHLEWEPFRKPENPIPAPTRTLLVNALVKLAEMKTPPEGRSAEGQLWMRRRAVECLGLAGAVTATPNIIAPVEKVLKDNTEPLNLRFVAADALGQMNIPAAQRMDSMELTRTLGNLAVTAVKAEFTRLESMDKTAEEHNAIYATLGQGGAGAGLAGPGFQRGGEGFGGGPPGGEGLGGLGAGAAGFAPDPKAYRLDPVRKRLRYQLYCVQTGLGFPLDKTNQTTTKRRGAQRIATSPADKKAAEDVLTAVNKLAEAIEKNKIDLIELKSTLQNEAKALEGVIARVTPAPAAAPADPAAPMAGGAAAKPAAAAPAEEDLLGGGAPAKK